MKNASQNGSMNCLQSKSNWSHNKSPDLVRILLYQVRKSINYGPDLVRIFEIFGPDLVWISNFLVRILNWGHCKLLIMGT